MVRVATELRETLVPLLQVAPTDSASLHALITSYCDIARELGQQHDVERMLHDLLPDAQFVLSPATALSLSVIHSSRSSSPSQASTNAPST